MISTLTWPVSGCNRSTCTLEESRQTTERLKRLLVCHISSQTSTELLPHTHTQTCTGKGLLYPTLSIHTPLFIQEKDAKATRTVGHCVHGSAQVLCVWTCMIKEAVSGYTLPVCVCVCACMWVRASILCLRVSLCRVCSDVSSI